MGLLGKYIDALSDEQRDRIIEAKDFTLNCHNRGCYGCLVVTAEVENIEEGRRYFDFPVAAMVGHRDGTYESEVEYRFPHLTTRFGKDRIVAACKSRAAKNNQSIHVEIDIHELELSSEVEVS